MKFEQWLKQQKDRDDPIGDLANDFIFVAKDVWNTERKLITVSESFKLFSPCSGALEAYRDAKKEYRKYKEELKKE